MSYLVRRFGDATDFLSAAEPFLAQYEAQNSLILGVARSQQRLVDRRRRRGLYLLVRGPNGPALAGLNSSSHKFLLAGMDDDRAISTLVAELSPSPELIPGVFGEETLVRTFAGNWRAQTGRSAVSGLRQKLYCLTAVLPPVNIPEGRLRLATVRESELLSRWVQAFQLEAMPEEAADLDAARIIVDGLLARKDLYVWETGQEDSFRIVTMAARARPTQRGIAINLVYTPPEERRQGFASACVAGLSQTLLDEGWSFCTLFTDSANPTSNHIYTRIGYNPIADFVQNRFLVSADPNVPS